MLRQEILQRVRCIHQCKTFTFPYIKMYLLRGKAETSHLLKRHLDFIQSQAFRFLLLKASLPNVTLLDLVAISEQADASRSTYSIDVKGLCMQFLIVYQKVTSTHTENRFQKHPTSESN
jgi:hypothetical protein